MALRPPVRPGLQGDIRSQVPYFTEFGQNKTVHPLLALLGKVAYEGTGAKDIVNLTRALAGDPAAQVPRGYLPFQAGIRVGGRYAPKTPGLVAESLQRGDEMVNFEGELGLAGVGGDMRAYNLLNEKGEIVASANRQKYPATTWEDSGTPYVADRLVPSPRKGSAYVPSMWVREDYRKTPAMFDLYNLLSRGGKTPLRATFANDRLGKLFHKRMERMNPADSHDYSRLGERPIRDRRPEPTASLGNSFSRRHFTNRDMPEGSTGRQMAPVARDRTPTPPMTPALTQQLAIALQQERLAAARRSGALGEHQRLNQEIKDLVTRAPIRAPIGPVRERRGGR